MSNYLSDTICLGYVIYTLPCVIRRLNEDEVSNIVFQLICSYLLWPFAFTMGVDTADCHKVAELIGLKTFINEYVAFTELGKLIQNRQELESYTGTWEWINGDILLKETGETLVGGVITVCEPTYF